MSRTAIFGASGFVGSAIARAVEAEGWEVLPLRAPRVRASIPLLLDLVHRYEEVGPSAVLDAAAERGWHVPPALDVVDTVVNAAGIARPAASRREEPDLVGAHAVLPLLLRCRQLVAGVPALLHVSSAAVLGRQPLSASTRLRPLTPYARSKGLGEGCLLRTLVPGQRDLHVYRPTSVQRWSSDARGAVGLLARTPVFPIAHPVGPSTVVTPEDLGTAVVARIRQWPACPVSIEPSKGDVATALRQINPGVRIVTYPRWLGDAAFAGACGILAPFPRLVTALRRVEVLMQGQPATGGDVR